MGCLPLFFFADLTKSGAVSRESLDSAPMILRRGQLLLVAALDADGEPINSTLVHSSKLRVAAFDKRPQLRPSRCEWR